jgi:hypothetical protein
MGNATSEVCSAPDVSEVEPGLDGRRKSKETPILVRRPSKTGDVVGEEMLRRASKGLNGVDLEAVQRASGEVPDPDADEKNWQLQRRSSKQLELVRKISKETAGQKGDVYAARPSVHGTWSRPHTVPNVGMERRKSKE